MFPLRFPKVWLALGWLLLIGVVLGSLLPGDVIKPPFSLHDKIMHAGSYFVLMVWFAGLYKRAFHPLIALVLLGLGIGLDLLQGLTVTRSLDVRDMIANFGGIIAGLLLSVLLLEGWCQRLERRLLR